MSLSDWYKKNTRNYPSSLMVWTVCSADVQSEIVLKFAWSCIIWSPRPIEHPLSTWYPSQRVCIPTLVQDLTTAGRTWPQHCCSPYLHCSPSWLSLQGLCSTGRDSGQVWQDHCSTSKVISTDSLNWPCHRCNHYLSLVGEDTESLQCTGVYSREVHTLPGAP